MTTADPIAQWTPPDGPSLQERYAPRSVCYGCGPANEQGLHVRTFADGDRTVAVWTPQAHHQAFPGVLNGGIIGTLLDCQCNWTAAWWLMRETQAGAPLPTVTMEYTIKLRKPTPTEGALRIVAQAVNTTGRTVEVEGELLADGVVTASCHGLFIAVKPGHPGFERWNG